MIQAYVILYVLENRLRIFIKEKLEEKYGQEWWEKGISYKIKRNCINRKSKELESPWHDVEEAHLLWYITFEELENIIQVNWDIFQPYFKDQHVIIGKLKELEIPRHNST